MRVIWLFLLLGVLAGCGGSGTSGGSVVVPAQGSATVELSTVGGTTATIINAVEFTLRIPAGVTVAADGRTGEVSSDALRSTNGRALAAAKYIPATSTSPGSLRVNVVDAAGFPVGRFATLTCKVAPGTAVSEAGFTVEGFSAYGMSADGKGTLRLDSLAPHFTVQTQ